MPELLTKIQVDNGRVFSLKIPACGSTLSTRMIACLLRRSLSEIAINTLATRRLFIIGGQRFIERHLVDTLRRRNVDVKTLGRGRPRRITDTAHIVLRETAWDSRALDRVLENAAPDCILHLTGKATGTRLELRPCKF